MTRGSEKYSLYSDGVQEAGMLKQSWKWEVSGRFVKTQILRPIPEWWASHVILMPTGLGPNVVLDNNAYPPPPRTVPLHSALFDQAWNPS